MKYYKVEFIQTEKYIIDVPAESEQEAIEKARPILVDGHFKDGTYHYYQSEETQLEVGNVYDVTNTDDEPQEECCVCKEYKFMYDLEKTDNDKYICSNCKYLKN